MRVSIFVAAALMTAPFAATCACAAGKIPAPIAAAVADSSRPAADTDRDAARKPAQMLAFAGVKPGEQIAEVVPGGGYFTRVLSLTVGPKGRIYAMNPPPRPNPAGSTPPPSPLETLAQDPHYGNITLLPLTAIMADPPTAPKVDLVWTSDNYHDLHNLPNADLAGFNKHIFDTLKSGGVYIVIDHAAAAGHGAADTSTLHRIDVETVKSEVESVGFKLAGSSDAVRNPADPHTANVMDPSVRGHTDQFALKFVKP